MVNPNDINLSENKNMVNRADVEIIAKAMKTQTDLLTEIRDLIKKQNEMVIASAELSEIKECTESLIDWDDYDKRMKSLIQTTVTEVLKDNGLIHNSDNHGCSSSCKQHALDRSENNHECSKPKMNTGIIILAGHDQSDPIQVSSIDELMNIINNTCKK